MKPNGIQPRQYALYELTSWVQAESLLSDLEAIVNAPGPTALLFPDEGCKAFFKQYKGSSLPPELLWFTPAELLAYALKHLKLEPTVLAEPAYLALIADLARSSKAPLIALAAEYPGYFLSLASRISQDTRGYLDPHLHGFAKRLNGVLASYGISTAEEAILRAFGGSVAPLFEQLYILGFNAQHFDKSLSLFLGLQSARQVSFFLQHLEGKAQELLIRTLETYTGQECIYLAELQPPAPTEPFTLYTVQEPIPIEDRLTQDIQEHLKQRPTQDLVLVFNSSSSALGLGLSVRLDSLGIPYFSALKRPLGMPDSLQLLKAWVHYQQTLTLEALLDWLNTLLREKDPVFLNKVLKKIKHFSDIYDTNNAIIIAKKLETIFANQNGLLAFLRPLESKAPWSTYHADVLALSQANQLGWEQWLPALGAEERFHFPIQSTSFLIYLEAILESQLQQLQKALPLAGKAGIYLLTPDLAVHVQNAKIILAALHEAQDPLQANPLLTEGAAAKLNAAGLRPAPTGEGEDYVLLPQGYTMSAAMLRSCERSVFQQLVLAQRDAILRGYVIVEGTHNPVSDLLEHETLQAIKLALDLDEAKLQAALVPYPLGFSDTASLHPDYSLSDNEKERLQAIHCDRQNPRLPFDTYTFCLYPEDAPDLALPAKAWEEYFQKPTAIWFKHILKVDSWPDASEAPSTALRIGTWVHEWLTLPSGSKSLSIQDASLWRAQVIKASEQTLYAIRELYQSCQLNMHASLLEHWQKAKSIALNLIERLSEAGIQALVSEWPVPEGTYWRLDKGSPLALSGRIDAIASKAPIDLASPLAHTDEALWILDFKTGKTPSLDIKKLNKDGQGLQIALYALALRALGFKNISCSIVLPKTALEPQLSLEALEDLGEIKARIEALLQGGVFGMKPSPHSPYNPIAYPIATVAIKSEVLDAKARLKGLCLS